MHPGGLAVAGRVDHQGFGAESDKERGRDDGREHGEQCRVDPALVAPPGPAGPAGASSSHRTSYLTGPAALPGESPFTGPTASPDPQPRTVIRCDVPPVPARRRASRTTVVDVAVPMALLVPFCNNSALVRRATLIR